VEKNWGVGALERRSVGGVELECWSVGGEELERWSDGAFLDKDWGVRVLEHF